MSSRTNEPVPRAVGPYRHSVEANGFLFVSGQIPICAETNEVVTGDIRAATRQSLENLTAVLSLAGYEPGDVVKTTIYLIDLGNFGAVNEIYAGYFKEPYPARACVQVAALPKGAAVEIDAVAFRKSGAGR